MVREATYEEAIALLGDAPDGWERWTAVYEEDGLITGRICLSKVFGQFFGHDTKYEGADRFAAARLWLAGRKKAREWGAKEVLVHFDREDDPMKEFWMKQGFSRVCEIYRGEI